MSAPRTNEDLVVESLSVRYGGVIALDQFSFEVPAGSLVGLIGPNGAGKTTAVDAVCGFVAHSGSVHLGGKDLSEDAPHLRARAGLSRTWQSVELFDDLTVAQHCAVAAHEGSLRRLILDAVAPKRSAVRVDAVVFDALEAMGLEDLADERPVNLPAGTQKLVGVARALAASPSALVLDEPAAGLDSSESRELGRRLRQVVAAGVGALLIDHDTDLVFDVCDHVYVLDFGTCIAAGDPEHVRGERVVVDAYLGPGAGARGAGNDTRLTSVRSEESPHVDPR